MNLKTLDGSLIKINLASTNIYNKNQVARSKTQQTVGDDLIKLYPNDIIFTEVFIPNEGFFLDFFIPSLKLVIEVNGNQHYNHVKHFHKTIKDFNQQKDRDNRKRQWCKLNGFKLIEIKYD